MTHDVFEEDELISGASDATGSVKGAVQLAGDLGGTAAAPTVTKVTGDANGRVAISPAQATLNGTSAGTAVSSQPFIGANFKKVLVYLNGYENTTGAAQTITYPVAFTHTPNISFQPTAFGATVSTTVLTLPTSMGAPVTGWIVLEGF